MWRTEKGKKKGSPTTIWIQVVGQDLKLMGMEEDEEEDKDY